jgi:tRNA-dihydrouridine synthase
MIGRGALGRPWLLGQTADLLAGRSYRPDPTLEERIELCLQHARRLVAAKGRFVGIRQMRKHFGWYTKSFPDGARLRRTLFTMENLEGVEGAFQEYRRRCDRLLDHCLTTTGE